MNSLSRQLVVSGLLIAVEKDCPAEYRKAAAEKLLISEAEIKIVKMLFKSLILSNPQQFFYEVAVVVGVPAEYENKENFLVYAEKITPPIPKIRCPERPIIIGFGPAGMFAALELIEHGQAPLIFERGKNLEDRHVDVEKFIRNRILAPESNIQYGEGGAGLYSDGKLFSRFNNSEYAAKVLNTFVFFGAPPAIANTGKPHLGTDVLRKIVANIKKHILMHGGEIHYNSKMTDITIGNKTCTGVVINDDAHYSSPGIYLALGNSARDTFEMLHKRGVFFEQKGVSIGVRIEHPVETINFMRYGKKYQNFPGLGAATYSFTFTNKVTKRGAYTFCMCPGGEIVNSSSEQGLLVVNGMSYSGRNSPFSCSAIAVTCDPADYQSRNPLAGIEFQRKIERKAFLAGGGKWAAPAQNLMDFLRKKQSAVLNDNSYKMGTHSVLMDNIFPPFISETLREAFTQWELENKLFVSNEAILIGAETRTSCPVRIKRKKNFNSVAVDNLYPIGEGSGYAGGITSSAVDAMRAVETVLLQR